MYFHVLACNRAINQPPHTSHIEQRCAFITWWGRDLLLHMCLVLLLCSVLDFLFPFLFPTLSSDTRASLQCFGPWGEKKRQAISSSHPDGGSVGHLMDDKWCKCFALAVEACTTINSFISSHFVSDRYFLGGEFWWVARIGQPVSVVFLSLACTRLKSAFGSDPACSQQFPLQECAQQHYHDEKLLI